MDRQTTIATLNQAADVFVDDALENDSPNFRTHSVLVGDELWVITVRRTGGKTPDQIIRELRAENERLRKLIRQFIGKDQGYYFRHSITEEEGTWDPCRECRFCKHVWKAAPSENHADDCPVILARKELGNG